jgi:hypothetical protein
LDSELSLTVGSLKKEEVCDTIASVCMETSCPESVEVLFRFKFERLNGDVLEIGILAIIGFVVGESNDFLSVIVFSPIGSLEVLKASRNFNEMIVFNRFVVFLEHLQHSQNCKDAVSIISEFKCALLLLLLLLPRLLVPAKLK